ncbi:MAG: STAS domain-containing protein [Acidimicrobiales bacterium]
MTTPAPFEVRVDRAADPVRVTAQGDLDIAHEDAVVDAVSTAAADAACTAVLLDLTDVTFMDSSGLRSVLRAHRAAEAAGVRFVVGVAEGGPVVRLFRIAGVAGWLDYA